MKRCSRGEVYYRLCQRGWGLHITHGATMELKRCSHNNLDRKGGVCWTHGAKMTKKCWQPRGIVCHMHGTRKKQCSHEGCTNYVQKGGVCVTHGAKVKLFNFEGCTNQAMKGGVCVTHGAKWRHKQWSLVTHGLKWNNVAMRGVLTRLFREEFVTGMATRHHSLHTRINIYIFICSNETLSTRRAI